jgi:molybdate transport system ATP-binding protein
VSITLQEPRSTSILNVLPARIVSSRALGEREMVLLLALGREGDGANLLARVTKRSWDQLKLADGLPVFAQIKSAALASR